MGAEGFADLPEERETVFGRRNDEIGGFERVDFGRGVVAQERGGGVGGREQVGRVVEDETDKERGEEKTGGAEPVGLTLAEELKNGRECDELGGEEREVRIRGGEPGAERGGEQESAARADGGGVAGDPRAKEEKQRDDEGEGERERDAPAEIIVGEGKKEGGGEGPFGAPAEEAGAQEERGGVEDVDGGESEIDGEEKAENAGQRAQDGEDKAVGNRVSAPVGPERCGEPGKVGVSEKWLREVFGRDLDAGVDFDRVAVKLERRLPGERRPAVGGGAPDEQRDEGKAEQRNEPAETHRKRRRLGEWNGTG